jgi:tetratricopeptide (TPR) repeat protein
MFCFLFLGDGKTMSGKSEPQNRKRGRAFSKYTLGVMGITCLVMGPSSPAQTPSDRAQQWFERGVQLQKGGDLLGARRAYEAALELNPRRVQVLANLGQTLAQLGEYEQAVKYYNKALVVDPKQNPIRFQLAVAYFQNHQWEQARGEFSLLKTAHPRDYRVRHLLALCLLKLNQSSEGISELEEVCKAQPENLSALYTLESAYIAAKQLEKAGALVDTRLKSLDSAEAHFLVGSYYNARKEFRKSFVELQIAKQMNAELPGVDSQIGYALLFTGNRSSAREAFEKELRRNAEDFNANAFLGWLYRQDGRIDEATMLLNKAYRMNPNDPDVLYQLALLAKSQRELLKAVDLLKRVIALKPEFPPGHMTLLQVYFMLHRSGEAKQEQAVVDRLQAEGKNQPTVVERDLFEVLSKPVR